MSLTKLKPGTPVEGTTLEDYEGLEALWEFNSTNVTCRASDHLRASCMAQGLTTLSPERARAGEIASVLFSPSPRMGERGRGRRSKKQTRRHTGSRLYILMWYDKIKVTEKLIRAFGRH